MTDYHRMSVGQKRSHAARAQREPALVCARCAAHVMPRELEAHIERCSEELPPPHPASRWLKRDEALRYVAGSTLDRWQELELLRVRPDGTVLERDLVQLVMWARALGAL